MVDVDPRGPSKGSMISQWVESGFMNKGVAKCLLGLKGTFKPPVLNLPE